MKRAHLQAEGRLAIWCPGCNFAHVVRVAPSPDPWQWNKSLELPTLTPSILARSRIVCHSFVTDGRIQFLHDSQHALAGQTVDLPAFPEAYQ
jgi:hypothetical protein